MRGYRPTSDKGHRAILYQLLDTLLPGAAGAKETLMRAHNTRNKAEYDGDALDVTTGQVDDIIAAVVNVKQEVDFLRRGYRSKHEATAKQAVIKDGAHK